MRSIASKMCSNWFDVMNESRRNIEESLIEAANRLVAKGFVMPGDTLSQRIPELESFVSVTIAAEGADHSLTWTGMAEPADNLHHRIYALRPDVGAIICGQLPWTSSLARLGVSMPAVFDEQVRHLGVEAKLVGAGSNSNGLSAALANGANAYCLEDSALCFGMGLERLLMNVEILEKCAESFVLARAASVKVKRIPWLIRYIANGRLKKDRADAAARHLRGERSIMKAGY